MITKEEKRKIAARLFYQDNPDDYEDYHEAHTEFAGANQSDIFIDFCVEPLIKEIEGHRILFSKNGHVAKLRISDDYFEPITDMTEKEGEEFEESWEVAVKNNPEKDVSEIFEVLGWKFVEPPERDKR